MNSPNKKDGMDRKQPTYDGGGGKIVMNGCGWRRNWRRFENQKEPQPSLLFGPPPFVDGSARRGNKTIDPSLPSFSILHLVYCNAPFPQTVTHETLQVSIDRPSLLFHFTTSITSDSFRMGKLFSSKPALSSFQHTMIVIENTNDPRYLQQERVSQLNVQTNCLSHSHRITYKTWQTSNRLPMAENSLPNRITIVIR